MSEKKQLLPKNYAYRESNPDYQGEELDPGLNYGPIKTRQCRDCFCCAFYALFWGGMILIAIIAFQDGDPSRLASPFDPNGQQCGYGSASDYPYLYFTEPLVNKMNYVCVSECPSGEGSKINCLENDYVKTCPTPNDVYATSQFIYQCVPQNSTKFGAINDLISMEKTELWMSDLKNSWPISLGVAFIAAFLSCCAGVLIWGMIVLYLTILTLLGVFCLQESGKDEMNNQIPESLQSKDALQAIGITMLCVAGLSFLIIICIFRKISRAIKIMKCAAQFTASVKRISIAPVIMFFQILAFFTIWIVVSLFICEKIYFRIAKFYQKTFQNSFQQLYFYIFSCGEVVGNPHSPYGNIKWNVGVKRSLIFYIFGLFWNIGLAIAISEFIVASAASIWYFGQRENQVHTPVRTSFTRAYTFSFGSLCLGSGILALIQIIKLILNIMYSSAKNSKNQDPSGLNAAAACCLKCCLCLIQCFERFFRFLSSNAYIMMALQGRNFCDSAHDSFYLVVRNPIMFSLVSGIGKIFIILSTLFVAAGSTVCGYLMITQIPHYQEILYSPTMPTIIFLIISFTIAWIFMTIYGIAADTLLFCLVCDKELGRGQAKHCPKSLSEFSNDNQAN